MAPEAAPPSPLLIAGPTAVGKSEIALGLAERLGGEIIAADSMQVYRGLDIGTAKPTAAEQARVRHHLIDQQNPRRIIRAVEVIRLTGKPFSLQRAQWREERAMRGPELALGLSRPQPELQRRIDLR